MDRTGIGATLGLFVFESIQFGEYLHRYKNVIVFKAIEAVRVVKEDIGINNEVLRQAFAAAIFAGGGWRMVLFLGGIHGSGSMHMFFVENGRGTHAAAEIRSLKMTEVTVGKSERIPRGNPARHEAFWKSERIKLPHLYPPSGKIATPDVLS